MNQLRDLNTPAAVIDVQRMQRNIDRMQARATSLGVKFRPHVKTTKCLQVVQAQTQAGAQGITVSTLKEAEQFFVAGVTDILYAVGMVPTKLPQVLALRQRGCDLKIIVDNLAAAQAVSAFSATNNAGLEVLIEVDTDGHRSGVKPEDDLLLQIGAALNSGDARLGGVLTHAGSSYEYNREDQLRQIAEQERAGAVRAAERLRAAGLPCPVVSVGSTPTALHAVSLEGVSELRAGVYVLFDLVMHNVGVCSMDEIALSVLTTVIGHQEEKGWAIVDAGWMAMSRDRGTQKLEHDFGFGQVCDEAGKPIPGYLMNSANQEHGIVALGQGIDTNITKQFPIGTRLRILPNHACATGAQHPEYHAVNVEGEARDWPRFYGW